MNKDRITHIRDEIIKAALPDVAFDGWNWDMMIAAGARRGHKEQIVKIAFPQKMPDAMDALADLADREMLKSLENTAAEDLPIRQRIETALMTRFEYLEPHKDAVRQSATFFIPPSRKAQGAKIIWRTADRMWNWAGDTATDYNRYTKRTLLSGIIVSSTLYWFNSNEDLSSGHLRAFIKRRIEETITWGKFVSRIKQKR